MKNKQKKSPSVQGSSFLGFFSKIQSLCASGFFKLVAKRSILPATIFTKLQIASVNKEFHRFWDLENKTPTLKTPPRFSTFTLGIPINLWSYYFPTIEKIQELRAHYKPSPLQVMTQDGVTLCGMYFQDKRSHQVPSRTLIVFGGNGTLYKIGSSAWLLKLLKDSPTPFNIVMFDYRECGLSKGTANAEGLLLDGRAVYDHVRTVLQVPEDNIDLYGFSLGAAIATLVKANHPHTRGVLINNRSFQSLSHAIQGIFKPFPLSQFFSQFSSAITKRSGWALNPLEAWKTITSPKMVICHSQDPVVRHCASLERGLLTENLLQDCHHIHLIQKNPHLKIRNHHVQPLGFYNDHHGRDAQTKILEFLLKPHS